MSCGKTEQCPLDEVVAMWHQRMSLAALLLGREGAKQCLTECGDSASCGTACSGSDIVVHVIDSLEKYWADTFNFEVHFSSRFFRTLQF